MARLLDKRVIVGTILLSAFWWVVFGGMMVEVYSTLYLVIESVFTLITSGEGRLS